MKNIIIYNNLEHFKLGINYPPVLSTTLNASSGINIRIMKQITNALEIDKDEFQKILNSL